MIHLADVSEFQGPIDWVAYGRSFPAVIVRAHSGYRVDHMWAANRDGARSNVRIRGWYHYLAKSVTPETQAAGFCNAVADLRPGEFVVVDVEEGDSSQVARALAWMTVVDHRLNTRSWLYTGEAFARAHLSALVPFADRNVWVANYRSRPPDLPHTLWQHTDAEPHAGVRRPCDCSIYQGTADQLAALIGAPVTGDAVTITRPATPPAGQAWQYQDAEVRTTLVQIGPLDDHGRGFHDWNPGLGRDPVIVGYAKQGPDPSPGSQDEKTGDPYWEKQGPYDVKVSPRGGAARVVITGGVKDSTVGVYVSVA